jgi:hypothetical protein
MEIDSISGLWYLKFMALHPRLLKGGFYAPSVGFGEDMSLWDRIFMGRVIKDFGPLEEKSFLVGKMKKTLLLVERRGKLKIVFKWSGVAPFGASVNYFDLKADSLPKLRQCLDEIQSISSQRSPSPPSTPKTEGIVPRR